MIKTSNKSGIFVLLLTYSFSLSAQVTLNDCLSEAERFAQDGTTTQLQTNCYDIVNSSSTLKNKDISEDGNL